MRNNFEYAYRREIRTGDNTLLMEVFTSETNEVNDYQENKYELFSMGGQSLGVYRWRHHTSVDTISMEKNTMPIWWHMPKNTTDLVAKYKASEDDALPTTLNIVTFMTFMSDGRIQLQRRNFVSPTGKPIGNPGDDSINGGGMKAGESQLDAVVREGREELGVDISGVVTYVGDVYDAEMGRTNHLYCVDGYDTLLIEQLDVAAAVKALTNPEGIGRGFMWKADFDALMEKNLLTGISVAIIKAFPELAPPARPTA